MSNTINKAALAEAVRKTSKLRVEDVGGRKERPAETVQSCLNRGYNGLGSDEGLSYILRHAIKYYLSALEPEASPAPLPVTITPEVARAALDEWDRHTCTHETPHRGGFIWTICDDCGREWADDRGGFVPYSDPPGIAALRAALAKPGEQG